MNFFPKVIRCYIDILWLLKNCKANGHKFQEFSVFPDLLRHFRSDLSGIFTRVVGPLGATLLKISGKSVENPGSWKAFPVFPFLDSRSGTKGDAKSKFTPDLLPDRTYPGKKEF